MTVIDEIADERRRQIETEGWTPEHDDRYLACELAAAAACYAYPNGQCTWGIVNLIWPWSRDWWKPTTHRRNLVKAAALIVAEIERLDRKEAQSHD